MSSAFFDWLCDHWDELRKDTKYLSDDEHKDFSDENSWWINCSREKPCDSYDRLFALYIIDVHPEIIGKSWNDVKDLEWMKEFEIGGGWEGTHAYDSYEREGLTSETAYENMMDVIKKGRDAVLIDSYEDGGWFGAS